ncbi:MAG TPA: universal stress protein [Micromonosporaceae bacterium]|nr:universal stress protein [Micromonosporaceae bacterium]
MVTQDGGDNGVRPGSNGWSSLPAARRPVENDTSVPREGHVTVGVDGSPGSLAALRWAAYEATLRGCPLRVLYCVTWPAVAAALGVPPVAAPREDLRHEAEQVLDGAVAQARAAAPTIPVSGVVIDGAPSTVLAEESERSSVVVVGTRGVGGFAGLLLGSVSGRVAMHARCPVVVVPTGYSPQPSRRQRVVVGIDGSDSADLAARFALVEALLRQAPLTAVRACPPPGPQRPHGAHPVAVPVEEGRRQMAAAVGGWKNAFPIVQVEQQVVAGRPVAALVDAAADAQLLVVGSRGLGGFRGLLLGSVSLRLLHHTVCPVAVVHAHHHDASRPKHGLLVAASVRTAPSP